MRVAQRRLLASPKAERIWTCLAVLRLFVPNSVRDRARIFNNQGCGKFVDYHCFMFSIHVLYV